MEAFESVRQELIAKQEQLEHDLESARGHMRTVEADLERVHEALAALNGEKRTRAKRRATKKPVPTLADLQQHIAAVREEAPSADANSIHGSVRARVREAGQSLAGFATLFAQALVSSPGSSASVHPVHSGQMFHHEENPFPG